MNVARNVTKYVPVTVVKQVQVGNQVQQVTVTEIVAQTVAEIVAVPKRTHTIGAEGWHDKEGFNIDAITADGPLSKVTTLVDKKEVVRKVEPKDVIAKINGTPVATDLDLFLAVQLAEDPAKLTVEVISHKDGSTYTGTVSAAKVK